MFYVGLVLQCKNSVREHFDQNVSNSYCNCQCVCGSICLSIMPPLTVHMSPAVKLINAVVLIILFTALSDPDQYHLTSAELANDLDVMDDASKLSLTEREWVHGWWKCSCTGKTVHGGRAFWGV